MSKASELTYWSVMHDSKGVLLIYVKPCLRIREEITYHVSGIQSTQLTALER